LKDGLEKLKPDPAAEYESNKSVLARGRPLMIASAVLAAIFTVLTIAIIQPSLQPTAQDIDATKLIERIPDIPWGTLLIWISAPGFPPFDWGVPIATIALLVLTRHLWHGVFMLLASMGGIVAGIPKLTINRARPPAELVKVPDANLFGYSFPSGHVAEYVAVFGFIFYLAYVLLPRGSLLRWAILLTTCIMVMFVGASRVYMGQHWTSDCLAGYAIGFGFLFVVIGLHRWWLGRQVREARHT